MYVIGLYIAKEAKNAISIFVKPRKKNKHITSKGFLKTFFIDLNNAIKGFFV